MNRLNATHAFTLPGNGGPRHQAGNEKVADRHQSKQEEISATAFIIEVIGKQGDEHQARRRAALQKQIKQDIKAANSHRKIPLLNIIGACGSYTRQVAQAGPSLYSV